MKKVLLSITCIFLGLTLFLFRKFDVVGVNLMDPYKIECTDEMNQMVTKELEKEWLVEIHKIYYVQKKNNVTSIYMRILAENPTDETYQKGDGYGDLIVMSFNEKNELVETWYPKDGSYYTSSIKEKFPLSTHHEIFETWSYGGEEYQMFQMKKQDYMSKQ